MIRSHQAQVVWIGRRPKDASIEARLERLAALGGPAPVYVAADAGDAQALTQAVAAIRRRHGAIHGVVHAAIVLADRSLAHMDEARFCASLAAKVDVSVGLAHALPGKRWTSCCSSPRCKASPGRRARATTPPGCTFKDAFAQRWASLAVRGQGDELGLLGQHRRGGHRRLPRAPGPHRHRLDRARRRPQSPDKLMAAPLHQLAFVTTTKPWNSPDEIYAPCAMNSVRYRRGAKPVSDPGGDRRSLAGRGRGATRPCTIAPAPAAIAGHRKTWRNRHASSRPGSGARLAAPL